MKTRDVVISGGGIPGLVLGCLLGQAGLDVVVIDPAPPALTGQIKPSGRTSALMNDSLEILDQAGLWKMCEPRATPLRVMTIIDHGVRADFRASEIGMSQFGCNLVNAELQAAAAENFCSLGELIPSSLRSFSIENDLVQVELESGARLRARLLVGADGRGSRVREIAGISCREYDYRQMAMTALLNHSLPHHFTSIEFHRPGGPFTLVPMPGNTSSLVWLEPESRADALLRLSKTDFEQALMDMSEGLLGTITLATPPAAWPLKKLRADRLIAERTVLIAEAAHVMSPIGAQGLNLSLRDVRALAALVSAERERGLDFGGATVLRRYETERRGDTDFRLNGTHAFNLMVASANPVMAGLRRLGLQAVATLPPLKRFAMYKGLTGSGDHPVAPGRTTRARVTTSTR